MKILNSEEIARKYILGIGMDAKTDDQEIKDLKQDIDNLVNAPSIVDLVNEVSKQIKPVPNLIEGRDYVIDEGSREILESRNLLRKYMKHIINEYSSCHIDFLNDAHSVVTFSESEVEKLQGISSKITDEL